MRHTDLVSPYGARTVAAYTKPGILLRSLRAVLGDSVFYQAPAHLRPRLDAEAPLPLGLLPHHGARRGARPRLVLPSLVVRDGRAGPGDRGGGGRRRGRRATVAVRVRDLRRDPRADGRGGHHRRRRDAAARRSRSRAGWAGCRDAELAFAGARRRWCAWSSTPERSSPTWTRRTTSGTGRARGEARRAGMSSEAPAPAARSCCLSRAEATCSSRCTGSPDPSPTASSTRRMSVPTPGAFAAAPRRLAIAGCGDDQAAAERTAAAPADAPRSPPPTRPRHRRAGARRPARRRRPTRSAASTSTPTPPARATGSRA